MLISHFCFLSHLRSGARTRNPNLEARPRCKALDNRIGGGKASAAAAAAVDATTGACCARHLVETRGGGGETGT